MKVLKALILITLVYGFVLANKNISIYTEDNPPLNYLDNDTLKGPSVEIVQTVLTKLDNDAQIRAIPWARAYHYAQNKRNTALFSTTRNKQRENLFKWAGPIAKKQRAFFALAESNIKLNSIEDAKNYQIAVLRSGSSEQYLKANNFVNIVSSNTDEQSLRMLLHGRIDLVLLSESTIKSYVKEHKLDPSVFEEVYIVEIYYLYIAFHLQTADSVVYKWQNLYDSLYKQGTIKRIFHKYDLDYMYPFSDEK